MDSGKVSIIMPAYNAEAFLDRSITSVRNQTYENWELLIVDDGSTDHSREIVRNFASIDSRIKLLCNEHGGTARARNTAIEVAQGDYFAFIDADDVYHPCYLELMVEAIVESSGDIAICDISRGTDALCFLDRPVSGDYMVQTPDQVFASMYSGQWQLFSSHCNKVYRRHAFGQVRFPNGKCFEDVATVHMVLLSGEKVCIFPEPLYFYFVTPNSSSKTRKSVELQDREWALRSHWEFFLQEGRNDLAYLALPFYIVELISIYHRIEASDRPEDCVLIRKQFEETYKKYRRSLRLSSAQADQILAFRHPQLFDIRNMIRRDGIVGTLAGFIKRKINRK